MKQPEKWTALANAIRSLFDRGKASTLDLARTLFSAKQSLGRGQWCQLWQSAQIPFSKRKGDMLARVGLGLGTLDAQTFAQLPAGWSVLYYLAQLERAVLIKLVLEGIVHPQLTLREARRLLAERAGRANTSPGAVNARRRVEALESFIETTLDRWSAPDRRWACRKLQQLSCRIEPCQGSGAEQAA